MGAGLAGSLVKTYGNANVNQIQYGDRLQGLPSVTNRRVGVNRYVRTRGGGHMPDRARVFCINQLGGVGLGNKNSQFAPNADGVGWCPNPTNTNVGNTGVARVDTRNGENRHQTPTPGPPPSNFPPPPPNFIIGGGGGAPGDGSVSPIGGGGGPDGGQSVVPIG